ncbi:hypothetical protein MPSEU_000542800 [Mayamaea pseudoterrestris]|nr:hypothetical protein MPSEU_000542800 [Mayamaea pseudoterrestris]
MEKEFAHYVVTAHPPGGVLVTAKCNFIARDSMDVLVAKSRRLEVRQLRSPMHGSEHQTVSAVTSASSPFPIVAQVPINGRIICLCPLRIPSMETSCVFMATDRLNYAIVCYEDANHARSSPYSIKTLCSGSLRNDTTDGAASLARLAESGPLVAVDPDSRCIAMHVYDGLMSIISVNMNYVMPANAAGYKNDGSHGARHAPMPRMHRSSNVLLGPVQHIRMEERTILDVTFLHCNNQSQPQLVVLHQDARGGQHVMTHLVQLPTNLSGTQTSAVSDSSNSNATTILSGDGMLKKSNVDGGSSLLIAVPPKMSSAAAAAVSLATSSMATEDEQSQQRQSSSTGGIIILGQRQFTYCNGTVTKVIPVPQALFLSFEALPADPITQSPRYLVGDEFGNLHLLTLVMNTNMAAGMLVASSTTNTASSTTTTDNKVVALNFETLGSCALASSLTYLRDGLVFVGSSLGDSQLVQIHDEPIAVPSQDAYNTSRDGIDVDDDNALIDTTYLSVVEEYTHLGPIVDFDLMPTTPGATVSETAQCQVVTASGSSKTGSLRLIRNGIGMNEYASVEMPGIQHMWSVRESFNDAADKYLVQSFVGETRVLGVAAPVSDKMDDEEEGSQSELGASLEEMMIPGLSSESPSLYVGNVQVSDRVLQITEFEMRTFSSSTGQVLNTCAGAFTVATANEAGQIAVSMRGGMLAYYMINKESGTINKVAEKKMEREISCLDIHPFATSKPTGNVMEIDEADEKLRRHCNLSNLVAVGLWDDFTVRLLSLESNLDETICINLGNDDDEEEDDDGNVVSQRRHINNMMARSVSLVTLDFNSSNPGAASHPYSRGVDMLLVGLGDGTLISFAVVLRDNLVTVQAKKEVLLGTQRIGLVRLTMEGRGTCVLATGDRPTVIYLAGVGGTSSTLFNPKLCYSNVNLTFSEDEEGDDVSRRPSQQAISVNVATPFRSPLLFDASSLGPQHFSLCVADDQDLKLGVIDDIQKLHVTTCRIGMAPRRIAHCADGRLFAVGCIESGIHLGLGEQEQNMLNCIRFMDDATFDDVERLDMEPFEMIMSMAYVTLKVPSLGEPSKVIGAGDSVMPYKPFLLVGTAYALPDEDEPTRGRILVYSFQDDATPGAASIGRCIRQVTELATQGAVYSITQFYDGKVLCSVNSKTNVVELVDDDGLRKLQFVGIGHHGHILSLVVRGLAMRTPVDLNRDVAGLSKGVRMDIDAEDEKMKTSLPDEQLAIVGDLMRSISLVQYYPEHDTLEEVYMQDGVMLCVELTRRSPYIIVDEYTDCQGFQH